MKIIIGVINIRVFTIYLITNSVNDKKYVGQTTKSLEVRFKRHCWKSEVRKNMPITSAISKYGKDKFTIRAVETVETLEEANAREVYWAQFFQSFSPHGYNLKAGGRLHSTVSEETRQKLRIALTGKTPTEASRKKMSDAHKGQKLSESAKQKLSLFFKGKKPHANTVLGASLKNYKITLWNLNGKLVIVQNMKKYSEANNLSLCQIHKVIRGELRSYKGLVFQKYLTKEELSVYTEQADRELTEVLSSQSPSIHSKDRVFQ